MKDSEVPITGNLIDITMEEDVSSLDEVVVIGYGTMKNGISPDRSSVSAGPSYPVASAVGRLPVKWQVQVLTTEGSPDAEMRIRVRGGGSITQSNDPLFIVDGFL